MFLAESHIHTNFSPDSEAPMMDMARAAAERGASYVCFTDHIEDCSVNDPVSYDADPFTKWDELFRTHAAVRDAFDGRTEICIGGEVGSINHMPHLAEKIYREKPLDFIIGSLHSLRDTDDFYCIEYFSFEQCRDLTERYFNEYIELARTGFCDVLGHLGYTKRYMIRQGYAIDSMEYEDMLREIFKTIIPKGIGIEANTSGLRDSLREPIPSLGVLRLYRECGGEIITVGSDAHKPADAAAGIAETYGVLRELGYKYVSVFRQHKPEFIKL